MQEVQSLSGKLSGKGNQPRNVTARMVEGSDKAVLHGIAAVRKDDWYGGSGGHRRSYGGQGSQCDNHVHLTSD